MRMKTNEEYYSLKICPYCSNPLIIIDYPDGKMVNCSDCDFYHFITKETGEDVV
jgi:ssDNA-binding Zn-finger/Zn-ribbon topoisomerase 1